MNTQLFIWTIVALIGAAALAWRIISCISIRRRQDHLVRIAAIKSNRYPRHHHFIEIGHESEEFFVGGDRLFKGDYDYDEADDM